MDPLVNKYTPPEMKATIAKLEFELKDPVSVAIDTNIGSYIMEWKGENNFTINFIDNKTGKNIQTSLDAIDLGSGLYDDISEIINKKVTKYIKKKFNEVQKIISEKRLQNTTEQYTNINNTTNTDINNINNNDNNILNDYLKSGNINNNFYNNANKVQFGNNILKYINKKNY